MSRSEPSEVERSEPSEVERSGVSEMDRSEQVEYVSSQLLPRAALLTRLLLRQLGGELSRSEISLLNTLAGGPRRITELADLEGLAQPTMTILVKQLEKRGLVRRERQADDGRVVLVYLTESGRSALVQTRSQAGETLGAYLTQMPDQHVEALADATETLQRLITLLQQEPGK
jgi:DNA-binding MarR family transcriptional regulator